MPKGNDKYLYDVFSKAFHEVVAPELEDIRVNMATKKDVKEVKDTVDNIEARTERIERQLFKINDRLDRHGKTIDNHEKRIGKLEIKSPAVS